MRRLALALVALLVLGGVATADEKDREERQEDREEARDERGRPIRDIFGIEVHPYVEMNFDRVSDPGRWTTGATGGVAFEEDPFGLWVGYTVHDLFTDSEVEVVPFDGTAFAKLGLQDRIGRLASVPVYARAVLELDVPTGPDKLTLSVETAFQFDLDPIYTELSYTRRDVFIDDDDQVYPYDDEFGVGVGLYW